MKTHPEPGIDILNCGTGHTEVRIDRSNPIEIARAKRVIMDMLRRGYVLFVEGADGTLIRVENFDAEKGVYIIGDLGEPPASASPMPLQVTQESVPLPDPLIIHPPGEKPQRRGRGRPRKTEVPMDQVRTTAIARTAGG